MTPDDRQQVTFADQDYLQSSGCEVESKRIPSDTEQTLAYELVS